MAGVYFQATVDKALPDSHLQSLLYEADGRIKHPAEDDNSSTERTVMMLYALRKIPSARVQGTVAPATTAVTSSVVMPNTLPLCHAEFR